MLDKVCWKCKCYYLQTQHASCSNADGVTCTTSFPEVGSHNQKYFSRIFMIFVYYLYYYLSTFIEMIQIPRPLQFNI